MIRIEERAWRKSSHSGGNANECVEAAIVPSGMAVRDSKLCAQGHLVVPSRSWMFLTVALKQ